MSVYQRQRKDGTTAWFYDFMHRGVRFRGVGGSTKSQAIRVLDKKRTEVLNNEHGLQKTVANPRIEDFAVIYLNDSTDQCIDSTPHYNVRDSAAFIMMDCCIFH